MSTADMTMGLFGGLAMFLLGMGFLADGLKNAAGDQMRLVLERFTKNRVLAAMTGAGVTAVVQSSSVTTVLVVGFVSAGVMTLSQSVGVIMGANVGSTMTAQIVAFSVEHYAPALIAVGFFTNFVAKKDRSRHLGSILMGLGLVFFGMGMMSDAMTPLRSYQPFIDQMQDLAEQPLLAILIAAAFTALVQSSSATTGIIVVMAGESLISLEAGIAMALGANIGTCVTAGLSALGKPVEAKRAAAVHVIFNVVGVAIWLPFIPMLAQMATAVSPSYSDLTGSAQLAAEVPRQIANANTLFNVINTVIFLFFTGLIASIAVRLIPETPAETEQTVSTEFLNDGLLGTPSIALLATRQETARIGDFCVQILGEMDRFMEDGNIEALTRVKQKTTDAASLSHAIARYTSRLGESEMRDRDRLEAQALAIAASELNLLCDLLNERLRPIMENQGPGHLHPRLRDLFQILQKAVMDLAVSVRENDFASAQRVVDAKAEAEQLLAALAAPIKGGPLSFDWASRDLEAAQVIRLLLSIARQAARTVLFEPPAERDNLSTETST